MGVISTGNLASSIPVFGSQVQRCIALKKQNLEIATEIAKQFGLTDISARVLAARGFKCDGELEQYIKPSLKEGIPNPGEIKSLIDACILIRDAALKGQKIAITCDFDVDGLSGGAQMLQALLDLGIESEVFVPDRFKEGYGLNEGIISAAHAKGYSVLIAIDFGTTNQKELDFARNLGLKTVVVDHHHVGTAKSTADVFINPNQKGCGFAKATLCASALVWYLVIGLRSVFKEVSDHKFASAASKLDPRLFLDLATLGTICDMVPLTGVNRVIARRGLELLGTTTRPGLVALKKVAGVRSPVTCTDISFGLGPRINAAGRMVHGSMIIELLTTKDSNRAERIAKKLNELNSERQDTEAFVKERAVEVVARWGELPPGLVVWDEEFHTGVVGIVAQRLVERFYRPSIVLGPDSPGVYKGSVRGIKGFNVVEALAAVGEHLQKYGGHAAAGGVSILEQNLEDFKIAFEAECQERLVGARLQPQAEADTEAALSDIQESLITELKSFAPFGMGNPAPQILLRGLKIAERRHIKGTHTKVTLGNSGRFLSGMLWREVNHPLLEKDNLVNIVCKPEVSSYQGIRELHLNIQAIEQG